MKERIIKDESGQPTLVDRYNRMFEYIRVSVTDKCNFRCRYCDTPSPFPKLNYQDILRYEEILAIVRAGVSLGIKKVRVTGGEPLIRRGIYDFLSELSEINGIQDLSLTTNGFLLKDNLKRIMESGVKRLNISLDSLKKDRFQEITGHDGFIQVWESVLSALDMGFSPVKLNMVVLNGLNDDEIIDFAKLTYSYPVHVRFIEYMPIGSPGKQFNHGLLSPEIMKRVSELGPMEPVMADHWGGPARRYKLHGSIGEVGFISPVSGHFCGMCNRIRLTANGRLRSCLLSDDTIDVAGPLRSGCGTDDLLDLYRRAAWIKPSKHRLDDSIVSTRMVSIGG